MKPEESVRNNEYRRKINEVFFVIMESLLRCILINSKIISDLEELDFYRFFTQIKYIESTSEKINQKFLLFSKEIYSIRTLLLIFESTKGQGKERPGKGKEDCRLTTRKKRIAVSMTGLWMMSF